MFGFKQAWACLFAGIFLSFVVLTHFYYPLTQLPRYDFLFLVAVLTQIIFLLAKLEDTKEAWGILVFHVVATGMEVFKTSDAIASWSYPEASYVKLWHVPLFAGFMYSAVGSYLARVWRIFEFKFTYFPNMTAFCVLAALIYLNFFTHHYFFDIRVLLLLATAFLFRRTWIYFKINTVYRRMPLLLGFGLVSFFIWLAENIATYCRVWVYPNQKQAWHWVSPEKWTAWYLLMLLSFALIALIHTPHSYHEQGGKV